MLLNITIENFRSYNEPQTLSMIASDSDSMNAVKIGKINIRKSAVIYGANASGKSNFIKAISLLNLILNADSGYSKLEQTSLMQYLQFFDRDNEPVKFALEFIVDEKIYTYKINFDSRKIYYEALLDDIGDTIFDRQFQEKKNCHINVFKPEYLLNKSELEIADKFIDALTSKTLDDVSFLNRCASLCTHDIVKVFHYLTNKIIIKEPKQEDIYNEYSHNVASVFIPIVAGLNPSKRFEGKYNESDGVKKFHNYFALIKWAIKNDATIFIDELETSFHVLLLKEMIYYLHNQTSKAQLIFTAHNPFLLQKSIFHKDQVYFVKKNEDSLSTELYSLADFEDLKDDEDWVKEYIYGGFGAIPYLHSLSIFEN